MRRYLFNIFFLISSLASLAMPFVVSAAGPAIQSQSNVPDFQLQIPIDTRKGFSTQELKDGKAIGMYFGDIYRWVTGAVGILAMLVFAYAGLLWLTARGEDSQVKQAQKLLVDSIAGITLVLGSYVILATINPNLVKLPALKVKEITPLELSYNDQVVTNLPNQALVFAGPSFTHQAYCYTYTAVRNVEGSVDMRDEKVSQGLRWYLSHMPAYSSDPSKIDRIPQAQLKHAKFEFMEALNAQFLCPDGTPESVCNKNNRDLRVLLPMVAAAYAGGPDVNKRSTRPECANLAAWKCGSDPSMAPTRDFVQRMVTEYNTLTSRGGICNDAGPSTLAQIPPGDVTKSIADITASGTAQTTGGTSSTTQSQPVTIQNFIVQYKAAATSSEQQKAILKALLGNDPPPPIKNLAKDFIQRTPQERQLYIQTSIPVTLSDSTVSSINDFAKEVDKLSQDEKNILITQIQSL